MPRMPALRLFAAGHPILLREEPTASLDPAARCRDRPERNLPARGGRPAFSCFGEDGSGGWIRTNDQRINSPLRYRCATPDRPRRRL